MLSLLYFCTILVFAKSQATKPCSALSTVDITDAEQHLNNSIFYDGIEYLESQWFEDTDEANSTVRRGCVCLVRRCLWKCCADGEAHYGRPCGASDDPAVNPFSPPVFSGSSPLDLVASDHFLYFNGNPCGDGDRYTLNPTVSADRFYLQQDGSLYQPGAQADEQHHPAARFCLDLFLLDPRDVNSTTWSPAVLAAVCFTEEEAETAGINLAIYGVYAVCLLISVPFLLATLAVYGFVPELRNLHGQCLMAYVSGLLVAFCLLAYLQLSPASISASMTSCYVVAFIVYFSFMSSFFWLNVMCFDIWRTFSRYGGKTGSPARERRRLVWYGGYAWGMALLLTAVTALMQFHDGVPEHHIRPNFGVTKCWFADRAGELVYFYVPVFVLVVVNSALFGVTAHSIMRIRRETAILKGSESARTDQYDREKQRYVLYLKLFVVMGVNWSLEVLSFLVTGSDWMWIVADITNCALGIFIFVIFVWKNKVRNLLVKRYRRLRYGSSARAASSRHSSHWSTRDSTAHTDDSRVHGDEHAQQLRPLPAPAPARAQP